MNATECNVINLRATCMHVFILKGPSSFNHRLLLFIRASYRICSAASSSTVWNLARMTNGRCEPTTKTDRVLCTYECMRSKMQYSTFVVSDTCFLSLVRRSSSKLDGSQKTTISVRLLVRAWWQDLRALLRPARTYQRRHRHQNRLDVLWMRVISNRMLLQTSIRQIEDHHLSICDVS